MTRRITEWAGRTGDPLVSSITEFLDAEVANGILVVRAEVDDDLPAVRWIFYVLGAEDKIPVIERPRRIRVGTFGHEQWVDGEPEKASPTFLVRCRPRDSQGSLFLYGIAG